LEYLFDLNKLKTILNRNVSLLELTFDELICFIKILNETVIRVDYGEVTVIPTELSVEVEPIPKLFRQKEIVTLHLSQKWIRRNVEYSLSSVEVVMPLVWFIHSRSPSWMVLCWEEWMFSIDPSFFKAFH
jgi:hypothetical protein